MKESVARRWIEELRSGRHTQGKGALLCDGGAKCCLGVLQIDVLKLPLDGPFLLSLDAMDAAGMGSDSGYLDKGDGETPVNLPDLNDEVGLTFAQIADVIESNWETL